MPIPCPIVLQTLIASPLEGTQRRFLLHKSTLPLRAFQLADFDFPFKEIPTFFNNFLWQYFPRYLFQNLPRAIWGTNSADQECLAYLIPEPHNALGRVTIFHLIKLIFSYDRPENFPIGNFYYTDQSSDKWIRNTRTLRIVVENRYRGRLDNRFLPAIGQSWTFQLDSLLWTFYSKKKGNLLSLGSCL